MGACLGRKRRRPAPASDQRPFESPVAWAARARTLLDATARSHGARRGPWGPWGPWGPCSSAAAARPCGGHGLGLPALGRLERAEWLPAMWHVVRHAAELVAELGVGSPAAYALADLCAPLLHELGALRVAGASPACLVAAAAGRSARPPAVSPRA